MVILELIFDPILSFFWWILLLPLIWIVATPIILVISIFSEIPYNKAIIRAYDKIIQYWKKYGIYFAP